MKPYSLDLRQRIVTAVVDKHLHPEEVAERFSVSRDTVERYGQRALTGALAPRTSPGRPPVIGPEHDTALRAQLEAHADATLAAPCHHWQANQGGEVSTATMSRAIKRLGWTRKKRRWQPASGTRRCDSTGVPQWPTSIPVASSSRMSRGPLRG